MDNNVSIQSPETLIERTDFLVDNVGGKIPHKKKFLATYRICANEILRLFTTGPIYVAAQFGVLDDGYTSTIALSLIAGEEKRDTVNCWYICMPMADVEYDLDDVVDFDIDQFKKKIGYIENPNDLMNPFIKQIEAIVDKGTCYIAQQGEEGGACKLTLLVNDQQIDIGVDITACAQKQALLTSVH